MLMVCGTDTPFFGQYLLLSRDSARKEIILRSNSPWGFHPFQSRDSAKLPLAVPKSLQFVHIFPISDRKGRAG
jgi:hypothetical protein